MHCPSCSFENPAGMKFCGQCGTQLNNRCAQCGFENPPGFQFCGECGNSLTGKAKGKRQKKQSGVQRLASRVQKNSESGVRSPESKPIAYTPKHLAEYILAERAAMEARGAPEGERKTITALFADLKGSAALI